MARERARVEERDRARRDSRRRRVHSKRAPAGDTATRWRATMRTAHIACRRRQSRGHRALARRQSADAGRHNKTRAAKLLGLTRAQLYSRIEKYGLQEPNRKTPAVISHRSNIGNHTRCRFTRRPLQLHANYQRLRQPRVETSAPGPRRTSSPRVASTAPVPAAPPIAAPFAAPLPPPRRAPTAAPTPAPTPIFVASSLLVASA